MLVRLSIFLLDLLFLAPVKVHEQARACNTVVFYETSSIDDPLPSTYISNNAHLGVYDGSASEKGL